MFYDDVVNIGKQNWLFVHYYKDRENYWRVYLSFNTHACKDGKIYHIDEYDDYFLTIMNMKRQDKKELVSILDQVLCLILKGEI